MKLTACLLLSAASITATAHAGATETSDAYRPTKRRSTALMVSGIVLGTLGTGTMIAAGVIYRNAVQSEEECFRTVGQSSLPQLAGATCPTAGIGKWFAVPMAIGGGTLIAAGIPMTIVGAWPVPDRKAAGAPELRVGPGNASVRWRF